MGIPLIAPTLRPQAPPYRSPLEQAAQASSLRQLLEYERQQREKGQFERQALALTQRDREIFNSAFRDAQGSWAKTLELARQRGASMDAITKSQESYVAQREKLAKLSEQEFENHQTQNELGARALQAIESASEEVRPLIWTQQRTALERAGVDVSSLPVEYPGDEALSQFRPLINLSSEIIKEALEERRIAATEKQATTAAERLEVERPRIEAEGRIKRREAEMSPEDLAMLTATKDKMAALAAKGHQPAKEALEALRRFETSVAAARAAARRGERGPTRQEEDAMLEQTAGDYLSESGNDPDRALKNLEADLGAKDADPRLKRYGSRLRLRIRERVRPGKPAGRRDRLADILGAEGEE